MWIFVALIGVLVILGIFAVYAWRGKGVRRHETDYYSLFVMGLLWVLIGGFFMFFQGFEFNGLFALGLIFLIAGLANRDKWKKKKKLTKDQQRLKIALTAVLSVTVLAGLAAYFMVDPAMNLSELLMIGIVIAIVGFAVIIVLRNIKALRQGLPSEDEMTKRITHKSGYYAFIAAIWITLGVSWSDVLWKEDLGGAGLTLGQASAIIIVLTGLVFVLSYLYLSRSGNVD
jgi:hypothetical protein